MERKNSEKWINTTMKALKNNEETKTYLQELDMEFTDENKRILKDCWRKKEGVKMLHRVPPNDPSLQRFSCILFFGPLFCFLFFALYRILAGGNDGEIQYV